MLISTAKVCLFCKVYVSCKLWLYYRNIN